MACFWLLGVLLHKSKFGTDDRHRWSAPPSFCSLHMLPSHFSTGFGDMGSMSSIPTMVYDPFNISQVALIKIKPYLVARNTVVARQTTNGELPRALQGTVETVITWHVNNSNSISVHFVKTLICKCLYNTLRTNEQVTTLCIVSIWTLSWTLGREVDL